MALISFLFSKGPKLKIGELDIDVSESESHEYGVQITDNPIEQGANPTDNANIQPTKVVINGIVSDTPITFISGLRSLFGENATKRAYEELVNIYNSREPVTLGTGLEIYPNMLLESVRIPRDKTSGSTLRFTAVFKQVRIISTALINLPDALSATSQLGKVTPSVPDSNVASASSNPSSLLFKLIGNLI